tara:strand:+ start:1596 stop:1925 length:330 start_codon:yes stop_codon:yes gene_type:complete
MKLKWNPMETAPRDGSPVALLYDDFSGVVAARFGESVSGEEMGWFYLDFKDTLGELWGGMMTNDAVTDHGFAGWVAIPEPTKEAAPGGASCQSSEHAVPETTSKGEQQP